MIDFEEDIVAESSPNANAEGREDFLWVNKYRPRTLEHFCLDEKLKRMFASQIEENDIQNVCLIGGPGIGKTTLAFILSSSMKDNDTLFVSCASGEGRIEYINSKIVPFCQSASKGRKIVILDELDSASSTQANSFQKALRNVIEAYPDTRFIATANYQQNIISPILSRLPPVALTFSVADMISNLVRIMGEENIQVVGDAAKTRQFLGSLIKSYYPDMRMVIGQLQTACVGGRLNVDETVIDNKEVIENTLAQFIETIKAAATPLETRKAYNNEVLTFGSNGNLARLCTPYGLASAMFSHIVDKFNVPVEDLMELVDRLYKIEHSVDAETQLFGFLLKVKTLV